MKKNSDKAFNLNYVREHNVHVITNLLYEKPYSCLELAKEIKISDVAVNKIIKQLLSFGIIKRFKELEINKAIGRQHIRYTLNYKVGLYICVDFTQYQDVVFVYDFAGNIIKKIYFNVSSVVTKDEIIDLVKLIKENIESLNQKYNKNILGISLAVPGQINNLNNAFLYSEKFANFKGDELYNVFKDSFSCYVIIKNNVNFMAIGEYDKGNLDNKFNISTYLYVGAGLAAYILVDGKCIFGWNGYAGEIGSNITNNTNLNELVSLECLLKKAKNIVGKEIDYQQMFDLFNENEIFHNLVIDSTKFIGEFIINTSNLTGCNLFMISGDCLKFGEQYFNCIQKYVDKYSLNESKIIISQENNAAIIGSFKILREFIILDYYKNKIGEQNNEI